jgi:hypothetical protein
MIINYYDSTEQENNRKAFVSCSLRHEDKTFVDFVESILLSNGIEPFGTVGRYSASPTNPVQLMKENIHLADIAVIIATPRYEQKDVSSGIIKHGPSEMIHSEAVMAYMANKPVVVIAKDGTDVGGFIPNITQFIILDGSLEDYYSKRLLLQSLLLNACEISRNAKDNEVSREFRDFIIKGLAVIGGAVILDSILNTKGVKDEQKELMVNHG